MKIYPQNIYKSRALSAFSKIILIFIVGCTSHAGNLELQLVETNLQINHIKGSRLNPCVTTCDEIKFRLVNMSRFNYILYGFNNYFEFGESEDSSYCEGFLVAARAVFVYNVKEEQILAKFVLPDSIHSSRIMSSEEIFAKQQKNEDWYQNLKIVINAGETADFSRTVDFREFDLLPG